MAITRCRRHVVATGAALVGLVAGLVGMPAASSVSAAPGGAGWIIDTFAGTGVGGFNGDGRPAATAQLNLPLGVAVDRAGNVYISDTFNNRIRRVDRSGVITTVAGTGEAGFGGDGGPATQALLNTPVGVAVDAAGALYIADTSNNRIRKVDPSGTITTLAGDGEFGYTGDGGPASSARLSLPQSPVIGPDGALYFADWGNSVIRRIDRSGIITTVAGTGEAGFSGDGGPATSAQLGNAEDVTFDGAGNMYIADTFNQRVRKVDLAGIITTVVGTGEAGYSGDGGPATSAKLDFPSGVVVQGSGILFIADFYNSAIRRVDTSGTIDTVAGTGFPGFGGDGGYGPLAQLTHPADLALDSAGNLYIADGDGNRVRRLTTSSLWASPSPDVSQVGQKFTYELSVSGLAVTATGVTITAALPSEVSFVKAAASQGSCERSGTTVTCLLGTVKPGATATVRITVTARKAGLVAMTSSVSADKPGTIAGAHRVTTWSKISAAECGLVIKASTVLDHDIGPCEGNGIIVGADQVNLDLGGHRVFGFSGAGDGHAAGIRLPGRSGVRVANGTVSGFDAGIVIGGGNSNTVTTMTVRDNLGPDDAFNAELGDGIVLFGSASNQIVNNVVAHNGIFDGIGILGAGADANTVRNNVVEDTVGPVDQGPAGQGIITNGADGTTGSTVSGTQVAANVVRRNGSAGIANLNNLDATIVGNVVVDNGLRNQSGNGIGVQMGPGDPIGATRDLVRANEVHGNGWDGIVVASKENRILDNDAANNNQMGFGFFDLHDLNQDPKTFEPNCDSNIWRGNRWGSGGYSPACTAVGGNGPAPALQSTAPAAQGPSPAVAPAGGSPDLADRLHPPQPGDSSGQFPPTRRAPTDVAGGD